jgi:hypothetical protein
VLPPGQTPKHRRRPFLRARLAQNLPVQYDHGISGDEERCSGREPAADGLTLVPGQPHDMRLRRLSRQKRFIRTGDQDKGLDPDATEQLQPAG